MFANIFIPLTKTSNTIFSLTQHFNTQLFKAGFLVFPHCNTFINIQLCCIVLCDEYFETSLRIDKLWAT